MQKSNFGGQNSFWKSMKRECNHWLWETWKGTRVLDLGAKHGTAVDLGLNAVEAARRRDCGVGMTMST